MDKLHLKPYSFRSRMMWALYTAAILSCVISLIFAYCVTHLSVQGELKLQQQTIAIYLLELDKRTNLSVDDMLYMAHHDNVFTTQISASSVPDEIGRILQEHTVYTNIDDVADMPVTYVQLGDSVIRIDSESGMNLYFVAFFRVITSALSYLAVVVLMITVVSFRMSKPVHVMTTANERVKHGDFDVRLPANFPGEIGDLMRSFNDMTESLGKTAYLQKDFISSISHEFKTPIASIRGFAKLLQMPGITAEQQQEYIALIAQESDRLSRLSETLLRLTALEQQTGPANLSTFSLNEQLRQVILRLEPAWNSRSIGWRLELDEEVMLESDEALLGHVWINLIQNALKFSPDGSEITVLLMRPDSRHVSAEIADQGCGMDEETVKRIFDRFYQADKSRGQEGVGLGLCLVKRILDMLGGDVTVRSEPGNGSAFTVTLPLKPQQTTPAEEKLNA